MLASLTHPERTAAVWTAEFSPDGTRLFVAGYPSGIIQIWDVAARKEVRRIETPPGYRGSADYALLTPDWKTLYVPVEKRTVKSFERDGKKLTRLEFDGAIRVWDVATGKEFKSLRPAAGSAPVYAKLAPGSRRLVCVERPTYDTSDPRPQDTTVVWDLAARKKFKLCDGYSIPSFAPDGRTGVVVRSDFEAKTSAVKLIDLSTGKELASRKCPEKERHFSVGPVSPDGAVVVVGPSGKKGAPLEKWFFDARTLEPRGKLIGKGDPEQHSWGPGAFTPDGKKFISIDLAGTVLVWDVVGQKIERTLRSGSDRAGWRLLISPNGKTATIAWAPKPDDEVARALDPDPCDFPQPRVSLVPLDGSAPPRVLVAPNGFIGGLAFSPDGSTLAFGGGGAVHLFDLTR